MMTGSLVGFGVVFALVLWAGSAAMTLGVHGARRWLREHGPLAERAAVATAAILPVLLAAIVVASLLLESVQGADHCDAHLHHAHLCLQHGQVWGSVPWAVALLAGSSMVVLGRLLLLGTRFVRAATAVSRLRRASRCAGPVHLADSPRPFCFVAGFTRARIFASTAAWNALDADERAAVLAHEHAHVRQGDLWRRTALEIVLAFAAPLAGSYLRQRWAAATERLCDAHAAETTGRPDAVASAMVRLCRAGAAPTPMGFTFTPSGADLHERVRAVLAGETTGERGGRLLSGFALASTVVLTTLAVLLNQPLHHALETLLG